MARKPSTPRPKAQADRPTAPQPVFAGPPSAHTRPPDVIDLPRITDHDRAVLRALAGEAVPGIDLSRETRATLPWLFYHGLAEMTGPDRYQITDKGRAEIAAKGKS